MVRVILHFDKLVLPSLPGNSNISLREVSSGDHPLFVIPFLLRKVSAVVICCLHNCDMFFYPIAV